MSIFIKDIIATFDEAIHAYDRAEYRVLTFGNDTFRTVLLFMWIGAVFAFIASYYNNHYLGGFVEKLILSGATSKKNAKTLDLGLVAIRPEYQNAGINAVILDSMLGMLEEGKIEKCETNLNLETNTAVRSQWKYFNARQHKRRRSYKKKLENNYA